MIAEICGTTPDASTLRRKMSAYPPSDTTPSWMRAPPESFRPMIGAPTFIARSMILQIFAAYVSDREPPNTVKSCANTKTVRPSMAPWPVTTPSPGICCASIPKSWLRWTTNLSSSWKVPGSSRSWTRSRAESLPSAFWRARRSGSPPSAARFLRLSSSRRSPATLGACPHLLRQLLPVLEELLQADVGQGMLDQRLEHRERHGGDIRADARRLDHVQRIPNAGRQDLALEVVIVEDGPNLADDLHSDMADIVEASEEGADERRPGLGRQERLRRRENQRRVDPDPFRGERSDRPQPLADQRNLDDHVRGAHLPDDVPALPDHFLRGRRHDLGADRSRHDGADLPDDLQKVPPLLRHEGGVRGHAAQHAPRVRLPDFLDVRGIEKNLHALSSPPRLAPFPPDVPGCAAPAPPSPGGPPAPSVASTSPSATRATATTVSPSSRWMSRTPCVGRPRIEMSRTLVRMILPKAVITIT